MYLIISNYIVPNILVERYRSQHVAWVQQYINSGDFILAGPRRGKIGGVIVSRSMNIDKIKKILAEDSFVSENLVETQIVDFDAPMTIEAFKALRDL